MSVYEKIAELCKRDNIAVTSLESELGFGRGSIGKLKNGGTPQLKRLKKIADYFGVDIEYFTNDDNGVQENVREEYYYDTDTLEIAEAVHKNRGLRLLFDAARDISADDIYLVCDVVKRLKKTNADE